MVKTIHCILDQTPQQPTYISMSDSHWPFWVSRGGGMLSVKSCLELWSAP